MNDVFAGAAEVTSAHAGGPMTRLPPARAGGVWEVSAGGPPAPPLEEVQEVWGFSVQVIPVFPSDLNSAHAWLRRSFDTFRDLVWGEPGRAQAVNAQLIRYSLAYAEAGVLFGPPGRPYVVRLEVVRILV